VLLGVWIAGGFAGVRGDKAGLCTFRRAPKAALDAQFVSHLAVLLAEQLRAASFTRADGALPGPGDRLAQPDLARTLSLIAREGPDAFYKGAIADLIAAEMARSGGLITKADLSAYAPRERPPIVGSYRGYRVVSMPPPSSGGIALVQLLNILEPFPLADYGHNSSRSVHLVAEAARRVYADRSEWLGDPDFVDVPVTVTTSGMPSRYLPSA
jgi:gamma-glutamyltranspeptidase/glutathione hydrolase